MKILIPFLFLIFIISCGADQKISDKKKSTKSVLESYISEKQREIGEKCFVIGLIKKNDCLSCEQSTDRFFSDSLALQNSFLLSEDIRSIEQRDYLKKYSFLIKSRHKFDGEFISNALEELKMKFSSTIVIVVDEKGKIIQKGYLRDLGQNESFYNQLCWKK